MNSDRVSITAQLDMLSDQFDEMWANGTRPDIEQFALRMKSELRAALYELLIPIDIEYRRNLGEHVVAADYLVYGAQGGRHRKSRAQRINFPECAGATFAHSIRLTS